MTGPQIIVLATPVFFLLIGIELLVGWRRGRNTYRLSDALNSIGLGIMSQLVGVLTQLMAIGIYTVVHTHAALWRLPADAPWVWLAGLLLYDLCYYWHHRLGHTVALFWAAHVVHHQSEDYNLSTALRQTSSGWIGGWLFYLPMAILGFPPLVFGTVALIDLLYQYWVHTQQIGRLGWFDRWFCAPSNHRVHHAVNDRYLDRNYGGILIVWDRLFGSFQPEDDAEPCVYGTRAPLRSWNPVWANLHHYREMALDSWRARSWGDQLEPGVGQPAVLRRALQGLVARHELGRQAARVVQAPRLAAGRRRRPLAQAGLRHRPGRALRPAAGQGCGTRGDRAVRVAAECDHAVPVERPHAEPGAAMCRGGGNHRRPVGRRRDLHREPSRG
jgi:sterol desaturase/sphingolipid hydroxylase (fatty acid hydroxylase superfamily)